MGRLLTTLVVALVVALAATPASAQTYPQRSVKFILPFGPAAGVDITARLIADKLSTRWGKPVVVENRPGGDGLVAINAFISADDDHTLLFVPASTFTAHPYTHEKLPYNAERDLLPIANVTTIVIALSSPTSLGVKTLGEFVALARAKPNTLNVAAAAGNSDLILTAFTKAQNFAGNPCALSRHPAGAERPRREPHSTPNVVLRYDAPAATGGEAPAAGDHEPQACRYRERRADRGRGGLSPPRLGQPHRYVRAAQHAAGTARERGRRRPCRGRGRSDDRDATCCHGTGRRRAWASRIRRRHQGSARPSRLDRASARHQGRVAAVKPAVREIANAEKINETYVGRVLRLTLLSPDIVEAIVNGRQPASPQVANLLRRFPVGWREQRGSFWLT